MSIYYISDQSGNFYELDATVEVKLQETGVITDNPVESGDSVADHFINRPVNITFRGSISDFKSFSANNDNARTTEDYIRGLRNLKFRKQRVTFHFGNKINPIQNCFFERLEITQNTNRGSVLGVDSFSISASLKQTRFVPRALLLPFRDPIKSDDYQEQTQGRGSTEENRDPDLLDTGVRLLRGAVGLETEENN